MHYLNYVAQGVVEVPIPTVPTIGGAALRTQQVAEVKVRKQDAGDWRVVLLPIVQSNQIVDFTLGVPSKPRALVRWGFDGVMCETLIDWPVRGGSFNVWGDNVTLALVIPGTWQAAFPLAKVTSGGFIAPGSVAGGMRPTFSVGGNLAGGTVVGAGAFSTIILVPNFARSFRWHQQVNLGAGAAIPISWFATMDAGLAAPVQTTPSGQYTSSERTWPGPDGITLSPDAVAMVYQNNAVLAGDSVGLAVEFVLDLG